MKNIFQERYNKKFTDEHPEGYCPWRICGLDEGKVRNFIKASLRIVDEPDPLEVVLTDILSEIVQTDEQRDAIRVLWFDEVYKFYQK